jgi:hypothetical protein
VGAWIVALSSAITPRAHAEPADRLALPDARGVVELAVAGSDDDIASLAEALRELVGRLGLTLRAVRAEAPPWTGGAAGDKDDRARVFVDDRLPDRIVITAWSVKDNAASAPVERSVPRAESPAIVVEQVAHAVHATLESLLSSGPPSPAPEPPPVAPPPVEPPALAVEPPTAAAAPAEAPSPRSDHRRGVFGLDATAFASGRGVAPGVGPVMGAGGAVDVTAWRGRWRPSLWVGGAYNATFGKGDAGIVSLATTVTSIRAVPSVELFDVPLLEVDVGAGGGADVFYTVPASAGPNAQGDSVHVHSGAKTETDPVLTGQVVARIRILSSARILIGVDVDYDFARHSYTENYPSKTVAVLEPSLVRPSAMIGVCVPLAGTSACAGAE